MQFAAHRAWRKLCRLSRFGASPPSRSRHGDIDFWGETLWRSATQDHTAPGGARKNKSGIAIAKGRRSSASERRVRRNVTQPPLLSIPRERRIRPPKHHQRTAPSVAKLATAKRLLIDEKGTAHFSFSRRSFRIRILRDDCGPRRLNRYRQLVF